MHKVSYLFLFYTTHIEPPFSYLGFISNMASFGHSSMQQVPQSVHFSAFITATSFSILIANGLIRPGNPGCLKDLPEETRYKVQICFQVISIMRIADFCLTNLSMNDILFLVR